MQCLCCFVSFNDTSIRTSDSQSEYAPYVCLHTCGSRLILSHVNWISYPFCLFRFEPKLCHIRFVCENLFLAFTMSVPASTGKSQSQQPQPRHWWASVGHMDVTFQTQHFPNITTSATARDNSMPNAGMPIQHGTAEQNQRSRHCDRDTGRVRSRDRTISATASIRSNPTRPQEHMD